jgi:putative aldouronate transport system permease protein
MTKRDKQSFENQASEGSRAINKFRVSDAVMMIIITLLCLTCIMPFLHVGSKSISGNSYVIAQKVYFWPKGFTLDAYKSIFRDGSLTHSMWYSVLVTALFTVLGMVACTCAAYPLSKKRLKGRVWIAFLLMIPMYFGAGLIPTYLLIRDLGLYDNMWVLILPLIYSPYNMLIMKSFFQANIPDSLEESAFLDGATNFQILGRIVIPLSKPIIATLSLFYAVGRWNAYSDNMYYISSSRLKMIQYKLYLMVATANEAASISMSEASAVTTTPEVTEAAAVMFATIPIILIYPFVQKYFVKGVMIGAVKG